MLRRAVALLLAASALVAAPAHAWKLLRPAKTRAPRSAPRFEETLDVRHFQRGNLHTHTNRSDGTSPPKDVAAWYKEHGYQFVALTDHNIRIDPSEVRGVEGPGFVLIPGDEVTSTAQGAPVHVNALCTRKNVRGNRFRTRDAALVAAVEAIHAQGGVALVNHPNYEWALSATDIAHVGGPFLLEVYSGHPRVNTDGNARHASHQAQWDTLLAEGLDVGGVAVDDAHHLKQAGKRPVSLPGRGWVETFGAETSRAAICQALAEHRFYSSSGPKLRRIAVEGNALSVWLDDRAARVEFLGDGGAVLASHAASEGARGADGYRFSYALKGHERYVRARIVTSAGVAWTQAYRVR